MIAGLAGRADTQARAVSLSCSAFSCVLTCSSSELTGLTRTFSETIQVPPAVATQAAMTKNTDLSLSAGRCSMTCSPSAFERPCPHHALSARWPQVKGYWWECSTPPVRCIEP